MSWDGGSPAAPRFFCDGSRAGPRKLGLGLGSDLWGSENDDLLQRASAVVGGSRAGEVCEGLVGVVPVGEIEVDIAQVPAGVAPSEEGGAGPCGSGRVVERVREGGSGVVRRRGGV